MLRNLPAMLYSIAESLGVPILNGAVPVQQPLSVPALSINPTMVSVQQIPATVETSECLLLTNMFDPSTEVRQLAYDAC